MGGELKIWMHTQNVVIKYKICVIMTSTDMNRDVHSVLALKAWMAFFVKLLFVMARPVLNLESTTD